MPISRKEFESGELDPSLLIIEFLSSNPDYAYSLEELVEWLASRGVNVKVEELRAILRSLEEQEKVEVKMKVGMVYYIYRKPRLGFRV